MNTDIYGVVEHPASDRKTDYLYRISIKSIVLNDASEVLMVKESGRDWWDLPGGGMDHGEDIKSAIAREMGEEVNLTGDFTYKIVHVDDPKLLAHSMILQVRLIFIVNPDNLQFTPGKDGDEVTFMSLEKLKEIDEPEYNYLSMILGKIYPKKHVS